jgi:hypothetical protein
MVLSWLRKADLDISSLSQNLKKIPSKYKSNLDNFTKIKGKGVPLQAWTGPEGSRRLRLSDFKTIGT